MATSKTHARRFGIWTSSGRVFDLGRSEPPQAVRNWNLRTVAAHRDGLNRVHATTLCGDCVCSRGVPYASCGYNIRSCAMFLFHWGDHLLVPSAPPAGHLAALFAVVPLAVSSTLLCLPLCRLPFRRRRPVAALPARFGLPVGSPRSSRAARRPFPSRLAPSSAHEGLDVPSR